jgi:hypothetical protein
MIIKRMSIEMASDRRGWKKKHVVPTLLSGIRGQ